MPTRSQGGVKLQGITLSLEWDRFVGELMVRMEKNVDGTVLRAQLPLYSISFPEKFKQMIEGFADAEARLRGKAGG